MENLTVAELKKQCKLLNIKLIKSDGNPKLKKDLINSLQLVKQPIIGRRQRRSRKRTSKKRQSRKVSKKRQSRKVSKKRRSRKVSRKKSKRRLNSKKGSKIKQCSRKQIGGSGQQKSLLQRVESVSDRGHIFIMGNGKPSHTQYSNTEHNDNVEINQFGQDVIANLHDWSEKQDSEYINGCFDGHGDQGHTWSNKVAFHLLQEFGNNWATLKSVVTDNITNHEEIIKFIKDIFRTVEATIINTFKLDRDSGTTATCNLVMIIGENRYLISAAVGDSPCGLIQNNEGELKAKKLLVEDNGDNAEAVTNFVKRYNNANKKEIPPIIYSRLNTPSGGFFPNFNNGQPLPAWNYNIDGETDTVSPNLTSYKYLVSQDMGVGVQALNGPQTTKYTSDNQLDIKVPKGKSVNGKQGVINLDEAPHNYGNTVEGHGQNLTGFGDTSAGLSCDCDANVKITQINEQCTVYACSDGISDIATPEQMINFVNLIDLRPNESKLSIFNDFKINLKNDPTPIFNWSSENSFTPSWDDISLISMNLKKYPINSEEPFNLFNSIR